MKNTMHSRSFILLYSLSLVHIYRNCVHLHTLIMPIIQCFPFAHFRSLKVIKENKKLKQFITSPLSSATLGENFIISPPLPQEITFASRSDSQNFINEHEEERCCAKFFPFLSPSNGDYPRYDK